MIQMQIMSVHHTPDLYAITSITNPKFMVDTSAYGLYGCWDKQSRTLAVWSYAGRYQAEGLLHRTSIALSLARGLSQSNQIVKKNKNKTKQNKKKQPCMDTNTKIRSPQRNGDHAQGSRRRSVSPSPTRRKQGERRKTQIRTRKPEV